MRVFYGWGGRGELAGGKGWGIDQLVQREPRTGLVLLRTLRFSGFIQVT